MPEEEENMAERDTNGPEQSGQQRPRTPVADMDFFTANSEFNLVDADQDPGMAERLRERRDRLLDRAERSGETMTTKEQLRGINENLRGMIGNPNLTTEIVSKFIADITDHLGDARQGTLRERQLGDETAGVNEFVLREGFIDRDEEGEEIRVNGIGDIIAQQGDLMRLARNREQEAQAMRGRDNREAAGENRQREVQQQPTEAQRTTESFPSNKEAQLEYVRRILEEFENVDVEAREYAIAHEVVGLERLLPHMHEEVAREARTRIAIFDSAALMRLAGGFIEPIEGHPRTIGISANNSLERRHHLNRLVFDTFFNNKMEGIPTSAAWDWIQKANFDYDTLVEDVNLLRLGSIARQRGLTGNQIRQAKDLLEKANFDPLFMKPERELNRDEEKAKRERERIRWEQELKSKGMSAKKAIEMVKEIEKLQGKKRLGLIESTRLERFKRSVKKYELSGGEIRKLQGLVGEDGVDQFFSTISYTLKDDEIELGQTPVNYETDGNDLRKEAVRNYMIWRLSRGEVANKADGRAFTENDSIRQILPANQRVAMNNAERAIRMAENMTLANLESSVANRRAASGNDQLAEIIGLRGWRKSRENAGRNRGPQVTMDLIEGFGTSYVRLIGKPDTNVKEDPRQPIWSDMVDVSKVEETSWQFHCSVRILRYQKLKNFLLDRKPQPDAYTLTQLQEAVVFFNDAKKTRSNGEHSLRMLWAMGVIDVALGDVRLGWDNTAIGRFVADLTKNKLSEEAGSFLKDDEWRKIRKAIDFDKRMKKLGLRRALHLPK